MDIKTKDLVLFFVLTFVFTWVLLLPSIIVGNEMLAVPFDMSIYDGFASVFSAFGPMFAAIVLIARKSGWGRVWQWLRDCVSFRIKPVYILGALLLPIVIAAGTHYLVNGTGLDTFPASLLPENLPYPAIVWAIPAFFAMLFIGGGQEEFGWRGYAQQPLQEKMGVVKGSMLLGALWGLWHLPLWFIPGDPHIFQPFGAFVIFTTAFSVQMAWLYNASGQKFIIPWMMHAINNTILPLFPVYRLEADIPQTGLWVYVGINVLVAIIIALFFMRSDSTTASISASNWGSIDLR